MSVHGVRTWLRLVVVVGILTGLYFLLPLRRSDLAGGQSLARVAGLAVGLVALTWLVTRQVRRAVATARRLADRIATLATVVYLVVVFFAAIYVVLADQITGLSTRVDALYFSVTTLTTVGYGDIVATGQGARTVVVIQMFFDLIIVTSAISIVVNALHESGVGESGPVSGHGR